MTTQITPQPNPRPADHRPGLFWLPWARPAIVAAAALLLAMIVLAAPETLATMQTPCADLRCWRGQVHASGLGQLEAAGLSLAAYGVIIYAIRLASALLSLGVAAVILRRRPDDPPALLGAATLVGWGGTASGLIEVLAERSLPWWLAVHGLMFAGLVLVTYFCFLFPGGAWSPGWLRWLPPFWIGLDLLANLAPLLLPPSPTLGRLLALRIDAWLGCLALAQVYRYRRAATREQRQQSRWVIIGVVAGMGGYALLDGLRVIAALIFKIQLITPLLNGLAYYALATLLPIAFGLAIARGRLYNIEVLLSRALVYAILTAGVSGVYVLVVAGLGAVLHSRGILVSLAAAGAVAALAEPLRLRLQRGVNRLLYGDRDDPYAAISRLGRRLESALDPAAVLPAIVQTVREALRLPYAAIQLDEGGASELAVASGEPVAAPLLVPLIYQRETIGQLVLGPRAPGATWSQADRRLLEDLARQAGPAIHAARLNLDLLQARSRLVSAREEERRRLRRDLHDGLGPVLGAMALQADTARDLLDSDPAEARLVLDELTAQAQAAVVDIRRLVYALRPPALDDLGLAAALRRHLDGVLQAGVAVSLDMPDPFPALPAAVEVAAYRIVQEAVTNVVRHARARSCVVRLRTGAALEIEVCDDGVGIAADRVAGVGLASLRERAAELGGACVIADGANGGTVVRASLPLA